MSADGDRIANKIKALGDKVLNDSTGRLETAGIYLEDKIASKIISGVPPGLKASTIKAKGSSTPLMDKGQLLGQVSHRIEGKDTVYVGVIGSRAGIAAIHEFGAPGAGIPQRSFIRSTFNQNKMTLINILAGKR